MRDTDIIVDVYDSVTSLYNPNVRTPVGFSVLSATSETPKKLKNVPTLIQGEIYPKYLFWFVETAFTALHPVAAY